eukprot:1151922-Pelagomonas_calceolata.AAC.2
MSSGNNFLWRAHCTSEAHPGRAVLYVIVTTTLTRSGAEWCRRESALSSQNRYSPPAFFKQGFLIYSCNPPTCSQYLWVTQTITGRTGAAGRG